METLISNWGNGGVKGFRKFFDTYSKKLYNIACRHVLPADAEDIVQDMFVELWEKRYSINVRTTLDAYLYSMLKYKIFRFFDRKNELDETLKEELYEVGKKEEILSFEDLYNALDESLNNLSPKCRTIFEKKYFENKKLQEIADELDISVETVKTHLKRGFKSIRIQMKDALAGFLFL